MIALCMLHGMAVESCSLHKELSISQALENKASRYSLIIRDCMCCITEQLIVFSATQILYTTEYNVYATQANYLTTPLKYSDFPTDWPKQKLLAPRHVRY